MKPGEKVDITDAYGREMGVVKREDKLGNFTQLRIKSSREFQVVRGDLHNGSNSN
ncbi:carbon storage regulator [Virgibacillus halodenitrificans]|uniref:carbon storage regulator n=1 Tax=Virgibacillus halodenitrificans TaxID=1482 RepID=UPI002DBC3632|nr:carbon storage regulator [Virgibacillus halodenitrificans]MEC2159732.1 carbon storage regulator [Virgibacillus halodenitrificans]